MKKDDFKEFKDVQALFVGVINFIDKSRRRHTLTRNLTYIGFFAYAFTVSALLLTIYREKGEISEGSARLASANLKLNDLNSIANVKNAQLKEDSIELTLYKKLAVDAVHRIDSLTASNVNLKASGDSYYASISKTLKIYRDSLAILKTKPKVFPVQVVYADKELPQTVQKLNDGANTHALKVTFTTRSDIHVLTPESYGKFYWVQFPPNTPAEFQMKFRSIVEEKLLLQPCPNYYKHDWAMGRRPNMSETILVIYEGQE